MDDTIRRALFAVARDADLDDAPVRLYAYLAVTAAGGAACYSHPELAAALGWSVPKVRRAAAALRAAGHVQVTPGLGHRPSRYVLPALARPGGMAAADVRAEIAEVLAELEELLAEARRRRPGARPAEEA